MTANVQPLIRLDDVKKVFYTDEVETHALAGTHLFQRVDVLERFATPPTLVAHVDRRIYGVAMVPFLTAFSLGLIPTTITEEYGYSFMLAPTSQPQNRLSIEFTYTDTSTIGWWGMFVNRVDGTLGDVYRHPQLHDALAWRIVAQRQPICAYAQTCDRIEGVSTDELIEGLDIALGAALPDNCSGLDIDEDGAVSIDELIVAVHHALDSCVP